MPSLQKVPPFPSDSSLLPSPLKSRLFVLARSITILLAEEDVLNSMKC